MAPSWGWPRAAAGVQLRAGLAVMPHARVPVGVRQYTAATARHLSHGHLQHGRAQEIGVRDIPSVGSTLCQLHAASHVCSILLRTPAEIHVPAFSSRNHGLRNVSRANERCASERPRSSSAQQGVRAPDDHVARCSLLTRRRRLSWVMREDGEADLHTLAPGRPWLHGECAPMRVNRNSMLPMNDITSRITSAVRMSIPAVRLRRLRLVLPASPPPSCASLHAAAATRSHEGAAQPSAQRPAPRHVRTHPHKRTRRQPTAARADTASSPFPAPSHGWGVCGRVFAACVLDASLGSLTSW